MELVCPVCNGSGVVGDNNEPCSTCGGDGKILLADADFSHIRGAGFRALRGTIWDLLLTSLASLDTKIDALQADITTIKAKTDNMPDDLVNVLQDIHGHVH